MIWPLFVSLFIPLIFLGIGSTFLKFHVIKENIIQTVFIGFSILVVVVNLLIRFFPVKDFSNIFYLIFVGVLLFAILKIKKWIHWIEFWHVYAMFIVAIAFRFWFGAVDGVVTTVQPTTNHDDIYYVYTAAWLNDNIFSHVNNFSDRAISYQYSAPINSMVLPRVGIESIVALAADIFKIEIHVAYFVLNSIGFALLILSLLNIVTEDLSGRKEACIKYFLIFIIPNIGFVWANNNFPTLWGLILVAAIQYQVHKSLKSTNASDLVKISLLISALVCIYPELLTIVVFIFAFYVLSSNRLSWAIKVISLLSIGTISIIISPFAYLDVFHVASTTMTATARSSELSFDFFSSLIIIYKLVDFVGASSGFFALPWQYLIASSVLIFLIVAFRSVGDDIKGLVLGSLLLIIVMNLKNDAYGLMKAVEFSSLPVSILFCRFVFNSTKNLYVYKI